MSTAVAPELLGAELIGHDSGLDLGASDTVIAGYRGRLESLDPANPAEYQAAKEGLRDLSKLRSGVEAARVEMKRSALEFGRKVDAEAKRVVTLIREIEYPLKQKKLAVDNAAAEKKREEAEAKAAAARAEDEAERKRVEAEHAAERAELEAEREAARVEREELAAERKKLQAERDAIEADKRQQKEAAERAERLKREEAERVERERLAAIAADEKAKSDEAARVKREAEQAKQRELDAERALKKKAEAERLAEERKPDGQKLLEFAAAIQGISRPSLATEWGKGVLECFNIELASCRERLETAIEPAVE